jgi:hypothetical protein
MHKAAAMEVGVVLPRLQCSRLRQRAPVHCANAHMRLCRKHPTHNVQQATETEIYDLQRVACDATCRMLSLTIQQTWCTTSLGQVCDCCAAPSGAVATQVYSLCNKGEQTVLAVKASACLGYLSARGSSCTAKLPNAIAARAVAVGLGCLAYTAHAAHCRK